MSAKPDANGTAPPPVQEGDSKTVPGEIIPDVPAADGPVEADGPASNGVPGGDKAGVEGGEEQGEGGEGEAAPPPPPLPPAKFFLHGIQVVQGLMALGMLLGLLFIKLFNPGLFGTLFWALVFTPLGAALPYLYYRNQTAKVEYSRKLNVYPGLKGLAALCGQIPTWVNFEDKDRVEWLNTLLAEMWPSYDPAVCQTVKECVEPILDQYTPPGIKKIYFKTLTFGDAPFRIETVSIDDSKKDEVVLEMNVRWAGDPNIVLAVELAAGGEHTRMCPNVTNLSLNGTVRIVLTPLVDMIPCFGAILVSFTKDPLIKYSLSLGSALGGSLTGKSIISLVEPIISNIIKDMLVWPNRIVVPMYLPEDLTGPIDDLFLRTKGILHVIIVAARDLRSSDKESKTDPQAEIFTRVARKRTTKVAKATRSPAWNEEFWVSVQEPDTEKLKTHVWDLDKMEVTAMFKGKLKKAKGGRDTIGKGEIKLRPICERPGVTVEDWFPLGGDDWSNEDGPGWGKGEMKLRLTYLPVSMLDPSMSTRGVLFVWIKHAEEVPVAAGQQSMLVHISIEVGKDKKKDVKKTWAARTMPGKRGQRADWFRLEFSWYDMPPTAPITIRMYEPSSFGDGLIGTVADEKDSGDPGQEALEDIMSVAESQTTDINGVVTRGTMEKDFLLDCEGNGAYPTIRARLQFIPMDQRPSSDAAVVPYNDAA